MKKILYLSIFLAVLLWSCNDAPYQTLNGTIQGTTYHIVYQSYEFLAKEVDSIFNEIDNSFSIYNEKSLLYKANHNEDVLLNKYFIDVFQAAYEISETSNGKYDISVGPLVKLYGFGKENKVENITDSMVDSILKFVGYKKVKIVNNKLVKEDPRIELDMNSIAQGYTCDIIGDFFERRGIRNYLIEVGGEILVNGNNELGNTWRIAIEKPIENTDNADRKIELIIGVKNQKMGIATSGNYRKYYFEKGVKFTHSLNSYTGKPIRDSLLSVTILAQDGITADGYATACMVSGFEGAKNIISQKGFEAFLIYLDAQGKYKFYFTSGFKKYIIEQENK